jgi:hypothetical protein
MTVTIVRRELLAALGGAAVVWPLVTARSRGAPVMKGRSSLLPVGADRHLPGGAVRRFDARPLRPVRPDWAKHMDDTAERHYTEKCQQT